MNTPHPYLALLEPLFAQELIVRKSPIDFPVLISDLPTCPKGHLAEKEFCRQVKTFFEKWREFYLELARVAKEEIDWEGGRQGGNLLADFLVKFVEKCRADFERTDGEDEKQLVRQEEVNDLTMDATGANIHIAYLDIFTLIGIYFLQNVNS